MKSCIGLMAIVLFGLPACGSSDGDGLGGNPKIAGSAPRDWVGTVSMAHAVSLLNADSSPPLEYQLAFDRSAAFPVLPVAADLDGDGFDSLGLFDTRKADFYFDTDGDPSNVEQVVPFGPESDTIRFFPIAGDFDGDGIDDLGTYDLQDGAVRIRKSSDGSTLEDSIAAVKMPLAGDWDGDGIDTLATYDVKTGELEIDGAAPVVLAVDPPPSDSLIAVAGDFDGDGRDSVGLFDITARTFYLKNQLTSGATDLVVQASPSTWNWFPVAGRWQTARSSNDWSGFAWDTASAESQGVDTTVLDLALDTGEKLPTLNSILIVRHGKLIAERYFHGARRNLATNVKSVSKSFLSALLGLAVERGALTGKESVGQFFPALPADKQSITIGHLLTMTAGLHWDEASSDFFSGWVSSHEWCRWPLELASEAPPGTVFQYNTGLTQAAAGILTQAVGTDLRSFAEQALFEPLGVRAVRWDKAPDGVYAGGWEMFFVPRDLARFGELYLRGGALDGRQIVHPDWVKATTAPLVPPTITDGTFGYGGWWWIRALAGHATVQAVGHGGQLIVIVPDLDAVMVMTANSDVEHSASETTIGIEREFLAKLVVPAFGP